MFGEWKFQKDFRYTPRADTFSNGFGRNQIKRYINRVLQRNNDQMIQMMKRIEALEDLLDQDNEYHFDSNTYSDN